ncbi:MAG: glycosyltransferase, partial [Candidatus Omnitrophica bacterium]|nr:glycosyltransferase [Candidatus Omnitrophota bacterium]
LDQFPYSPKTWESGAPFVIGWAGTFQPYEGFETFIDLAEMFRGKGEDIRFLIVGDGPARPEYERAIQKRGLGEAFDFRGKVDWREVPDILAQAHCCILVPTLSEAGKAYRDAIGMTQMKFYEYLALGKPVMTYRLGDAEDLVEKNGAGITSHPSPEDLAEAILKLKGSDLESMARSARTLAEDRFTWEKTAESIHEGLLNRFSDSD